MFGPLGFSEVLFILLVALLVFGPKRLPQMGRTLGRAVREFRRATTDLKRSVEQEIGQLDAEEEAPKRPSPAAPGPMPPSTTGS